VAFLKFTRDQRGYEHFYLLEPSTRRAKTRTRVLYWFRTPPGIKIGRDPFDPTTRRALEARNPAVSFDWDRILAASIPSAGAEKWRERRREERGVRRARKARKRAADASEPGEPDQTDNAKPVASGPLRE
jgi:hypothetical protein